jgi:hypothetical protein
LAALKWAREQIAKPGRPPERARHMLLVDIHAAQETGSPACYPRDGGVSSVFSVFPCPLCRDLGRAVLLVAAIEPVGRLMAVVDVEGCVHAQGFGVWRR